MEIIIRKRPTKRHGIAFDLDYRWQGQRYKPLLGYNLTPEDAQRRAVAMIAKIQHGERAHHAQSITLRDVLPLFWQSFQIKKRVDRMRPEGILENHLLSCKACKDADRDCAHRFGHRALASLTPADGLDFIRQRTEEGASAGTIRREWQVLTRILNLAVRYERLDKNRLSAVELPEPEKRTRVVEPDELDRLRTVKGEAVDELWRIVVVATNTGLREAKLLSLRRSWIRKKEVATGLRCPQPRRESRAPPQKSP